MDKQQKSKPTDPEETETEVEGRKSAPDSTTVPRDTPNTTVPRDTPSTTVPRDDA